MYGSDASPCPLVVAIETQLAVVATDHAQSRVVEIVNVPVPPSAGNEVGTEAAEIWHFSEEGPTTAVDVSVEVQATSPATVKTIARIAGRMLRRITITRHVMHGLRHVVTHENCQ